MPFQAHGIEVHVGLLYPNRFAASDLNSNAATWLHTSPLLQKVVENHQLYQTSL